MAEITLGLVGEMELVVTEQLTALAYASGLVAGFATPAMIGLMEGASVNATQKCLQPGQTSVGIEVNVKHLAATPVGMHVRARAEVIGVEGRRVLFKVEAWDEREKIGEGTHQRMIVDEMRFNEKIAGKTKRD